MLLSKANLALIRSLPFLQKPALATFNLPEKVLQFGTGVLLRGLPDYLVNKANAQGIFNGRIVVVKSTGDDVSEFEAQDGLYTMAISGVEKSSLVNQYVVSSSISRVLAATTQWQEILTVAKSTDLKVVFSNTTEVGITFVQEAIHQNPPQSFPAKLLAVLYQRYLAFNGSANAGLVIVATELIPANGKLLANIVNDLAKYNQLEEAFMQWLFTANIFCDSLVDRIIPGKPDEVSSTKICAELGYDDKLLIATEPYKLWAIEGDERVAEVLNFATIDEGVIVTPDIEVYRELKVRLLNATHTLTTGIAILIEVPTVVAAMNNSLLRSYVENLMNSEIGRSIPYHVDEHLVKDFIAKVIDRFANPSIEHLWTNIAVGYPLKMKVRVLPLLIKYNEVFGKIPQLITFGFAAYLIYSHNVKGLSLTQYRKLVDENLADEEFWGVNLNSLPGFNVALQHYGELILSKGVRGALEEILPKK